MHSLSPLKTACKKLIEKGDMNGQLNLAILYSLRSVAEGAEKTQSVLYAKSREGRQWTKHIAKGE